MADEFPTEYDAIILGTGLPESVVAAALARVGKSVLHMDRNDHYSSEWATLTFDGLLEWIKANQEKDNNIGKADNVTFPTNEEEKTFPLAEKPVTVSNIVTRSYMRTKRKEMEPSDHKESDVNKKSSTDVLPPTGENEAKNEDSPELEKEPQLDQSAPEQTASEENTDSNKTDEGETSMLEPVTAVENIVSSQNDSNNEIGEGSAVETPQPLEIPPRLRFPSCKPPVNKDMTYEDLEKYFRQFNIDLAPKMLFSRGPLVEAIISANISHYAEFKAVNRILTCLNGSIEDVPCSRSDVFSSKLISAIEKRTLMKFLTFCIDFENHEDEYKEFVDKPFVEFLQSRRMTPNLQHFVLHAIAMLPPETATLEALKTTRSFLQSLGRYGNTPFIWPLYGIGELPQAFCRMCAVFGGLYCLRRSAESVTVDSSSNTCTGITSDGQFLKCKWLIVEPSYLPKQWSKETSRSVSRAVFVTDKFLKGSESGTVTLMSMPKTHDSGSPITVIELDKSTAACPSGLHVVHLVTESCGTAMEDLQATAEELLYFPQSDDDRESDKPVVLWSLYFNHAATDQSCVEPTLPSNVQCTSLPGSSLGFSSAMSQAKEIFQTICGHDEEFLPAIPNPEDIIMDDIGQEEQGNNSALVGGIVSGQDNENPPNPSPEEEASGREEESSNTATDESIDDHSTNSNQNDVQPEI